MKHSVGRWCNLPRRFLHQTSYPLLFYEQGHFRLRFLHLLHKVSFHILPVCAQFCIPDSIHLLLYSADRHSDAIVEWKYGWLTGDSSFVHSYPSGHHRSGRYHHSWSADRLLWHRSRNQFPAGVFHRFYLQYTCSRKNWNGVRMLPFGPYWHNSMHDKCALSRRK